MTEMATRRNAGLRFPRRRFPMALLGVAMLLAPTACTTQPAAQQAATPVVDVAHSDLFTLTLASPVSVYTAREPLRVQAALKYVGDERLVEAEGSQSIIGWGFQRVGGGRSEEFSLDLHCAKWEMRRGEPLVGDFPSTTSSRLSAGTWRIYAVSRVGVDRDGDGPQRQCSIDADLRAEIVVTVH